MWRLCWKAVTRTTAETQGKDTVHDAVVVRVRDGGQKSTFNQRPPAPLTSFLLTTMNKMHAE